MCKTFGNVCKEENTSVPPLCVSRGNGNLVGDDLETMSDFALGASSAWLALLRFIKPLVK